MDNEPTAGLQLPLLSIRLQNQRRYNTPTTNKIGAIMVGNGHDGSISNSGIRVKKTDGTLQRVSIFYSAYIPLHYVLFFLDGRQGWDMSIPLRGFKYNREDCAFNDNSENATRGHGGSKRVLQMQYYADMLHLHERGEHLFLAGHLLQQLMVDAWAVTEQNLL